MAEQETFEIDAADLEDDDVADVSAPREAPLEQFEDETGDEDGTGVAEALRASTAGGRSVESESSGGRNSARPVCPTRTPGGAKSQPSLLTYEQRIRRYYGRARTAGYVGP